MKTTNRSRRTFLKNALMGGAGFSALASTQMQLISSAFAQSSTVPGDYKALVCIYLYGGNDSFNMIVPMRGKDRQDYEAARGILARSDALEITPRSNVMEGGLGFVPELDKLKQLFDNGNLAVQANVGPLGRPAVNGQPAIEPDSLFAHNSQRETWHRGAELNQGTRGTGWAGRMIDLLSSNSGVAPHYLQNISLSGNAIWASPANSAVFTVGAHDVHQFSAFHGNEGAIRRKSELLQHFNHQASSEHWLVKEYAASIVAAEMRSTQLKTGLKTLASQPLNTVFASDSLSQQLHRVAQLIQLRSQFNVPRQIFYVGLDGFDTHQNQNDAGTHPGAPRKHFDILTELNNAMSSFYAATEELGVQNQVTTFTMSEFGRSMTPNAGKGTDHGWGGHQFIMGGSVNGDIYGKMPRQALGVAEDIGAGRMKPTTSCDQMSGALARWYGLSQSECNDILPNLSAFDPVSYFS